LTQETRAAAGGYSSQKQSVIGGGGAVDKRHARIMVNNHLQIYLARTTCSPYQPHLE
jgi:hypothetical protein